MSEIVKSKGPWSPAEIERFLAESRIPMRLACNGASGHPVLASLWFLPVGGRLWCATQRTARVSTLIAEDPRCAFEVADERPPYRGVRGQGIARLHPDRGAGVLNDLVARYLDDPESDFARWLLSRAEREIAIEIEPRSLLSWDFAQRMGRSA